MEDEEAQVGGGRKKHKAQAFPRLSPPWSHGRKKNAQPSPIGSLATVLSLLSSIVIPISLFFSGCRFMNSILFVVCSHT